MKTMTCRQLGGACDEAFRAATFDEIAVMSKQHAMEMFQKSDAEHLKAMEQMKTLMKDPDAMQQWFEDRRKEFEALSED